MVVFVCKIALWNLRHEGNSTWNTSRRSREVFQWNILRDISAISNEGEEISHEWRKLIARGLRLKAPRVIWSKSNEGWSRAKGPGPSAIYCLNECDMSSPELDIGGITRASQIPMCAFRFNTMKVILIQNTVICTLKSIIGISEAPSIHKCSGWSRKFMRLKIFFGEPMGGIWVSNTTAHSATRWWYLKHKYHPSVKKIIFSLINFLGDPEHLCILGASEIPIKVL